MLGDDRSHCVQAIRNLLQSGIVAEALIEGRAAHDISQKDCGQNSFPSMSYPHENAVCSRAGKALN
ncbi:hypothetical protein MesoLj131a_56420 [Mesorhizobium sp. 131-2-1]|nr:hypothetical protein MesoLj131a_56420 [Mesorhizobium sp. 131-2-1]